MDADQLKTFLEVSRTRHFGRAAKNLFLSQSAISSRIKALEEQLGTPLFVRNRNDIQLTPAGNRLLSHAENILAAWNRARHDVVIEDNKISSLAIAGTPSLWDISLQDWLHKLHHSHPEIVLHGEILQTDDILRRLLEGTLDLGFTFEPPQMPRIEIEQISTVPLVMVSSHENLTPQQALSQDYVMVDWGFSFAITHARHFPALQTPAVHLPLGRVAQEYLLRHGGSAYLAEPAIAAALTTGELFKVQDAPVIERPAYALFSSETQPSTIVRTALSLFT